ncbi:putative sulfate exporter family transporter, partial [Staphylococcus haemolyticus]|uniref:putative sulfate exporter family transporter n=1 Tax=Staphylococcus haemolyticus TaxID=1283 RepID=UPI0021B33ECE
MLKSTQKHSPITIPIVPLIPTIFSLPYTLIYSLFTISPQLFPLSSATTLHQIPHLILPSGFSTQKAFTIGLLPKLTPLFLLIPR